MVLMILSFVTSSTEPWQWYRPMEKKQRKWLCRHNNTSFLSAARDRHSYIWTVCAFTSHGYLSIIPRRAVFLACVLCSTQVFVLQKQTSNECNARDLVFTKEKDWDKWV